MRGSECLVPGQTQARPPFLWGMTPKMKERLQEREEDTEDTPRWLPERRKSQRGEVTRPSHTCCRQSGSSEWTPASQVHTPVRWDAATPREVASSVGRRRSSPKRGNTGPFFLGFSENLVASVEGRAASRLGELGTSEVPRPDHPLPCRFSPQAGGRALTSSSVRAQGLAPCPADSPCQGPSRARWVTVWTAQDSGSQGPGLEARATRNTSGSPGSGQQAAPDRPASRSPSLQTYRINLARPPPSCAALGPMGN